MIDWTLRMSLSGTSQGTTSPFFKRKKPMHRSARSPSQSWARLLHDQVVFDMIIIVDRLARIEMVAIQCVNNPPRLKILSEAGQSSRLASAINIRFTLRVTAGRVPALMITSGFLHLRSSPPVFTGRQRVGAKLGFGAFCAPWGLCVRISVANKCLQLSSDHFGSQRGLKYFPH